MDIYSRFSRVLKSKSILNIPERDLFLMYSDLFLNFSPEVADHVMQVTGKSAERFKKIQSGMISNHWPKESIPEILKTSAKGLETILRFKAIYARDSVNWFSSVARIIGQMPDAQLSKANVLADQIYSDDSKYLKYLSLFSEHIMSDIGKRSLIIALLTKRYGETVMVEANSALVRQIDRSDLSVQKLVTVCDFIEQGGDPNVPVQWMLDLIATES